MYSIFIEMGCFGHNKVGVIGKQGVKYEDIKSQIRDFDLIVF
jgi:hypothetical protein